MGAEKDLQIKFVTDSFQLIKLVKKQGLRLVAIEQDKRAINLYHWQPEKNSILVFGNEIEGVSQEALAVAAQIVEILLCWNFVLLGNLC